MNTNDNAITDTDCDVIEPVSDDEQKHALAEAREKDRLEKESFYADGCSDTQRDIVIRMLNRGESIDIISQCTEMSKDEINKIKYNIIKTNQIVNTFSFFEMVKHWTINDYRTQKIKSEVILDMLISKFMEEIIASLFNNIDCDNIHFLAKEFPINSDKPDNNKNANIDFLLYNSKDANNSLFFAELKTTKSSFNRKQLERMKFARDNGSRELFEFFFGIINDMIDNHPGKLPTKKYLFTLKNMVDSVGFKNKFPYTSLLSHKHDKNSSNTILRNNQLITIKDYFINKFQNANITILYVTLERIQEIDNIADKENIKQIVLSELHENQNFLKMINKTGKNNIWHKVDDILQELAVPENQWFV